MGPAASVEAFGYARVAGVFGAAEVEELLGLVPVLEGAAGTRTLLSLEWGRALAGSAKVRSLVDEVLGASAVAVRGILFDKSPTSNWNLDWHQDTKICVKEQIQVEGFSAWSVKEGVVHCQPPVEILEAMVAVRIHLDPCGADNGPLRVIPGSHGRGLLPPSDRLDTGDAVNCVADVGDVLLMKPLLLHASSKSESASHRRVIHIEYCGTGLPGGLDWRYA